MHHRLSCKLFDKLVSFCQGNGTNKFLPSTMATIVVASQNGTLAAKHNGKYIWCQAAWQQCFLPNKLALFFQIGQLEWNPQSNSWCRSMCRKSTAADSEMHFPNLLYCVACASHWHMVKLIIVIVTGSICVFLWLPLGSNTYILSRWTVWSGLLRSSVTAMEEIKNQT